jgi:hypothetical protein
LFWLRIETDGGACGHGNEASGFVKFGEFLDWLSVVSASEEGLCSVELTYRFIINGLIC